MGPTRYVDLDGRAVNLVAAGVGAGIGFAVGFGAALLDGDSLSDAALTGGKTAVVGGLAGLTFGASLAAGAGVGTVASLTAGKMALGAAASLGHQQLEVQAGLRARVSAKDIVFGAGAAAAVPTGAAFSGLSQTTKTALAAASIGIGAGAAGTGASQLTDALEMSTNSSPAEQARAPWMAALGAANTLFGLLGVGGGAAMLPKPTFAPTGPSVASAAASYDEAAALAAWDNEGGSLVGGPQVPREPVLYGPFYRVPTTSNEFELVCASGCVAGKGARANWGNPEPNAKAFIGPVPPSRQGRAYEFYTPIEPSARSAGWATWDARTPGVTIRPLTEPDGSIVDYAFIPVTKISR